MRAMALNSFSKYSPRILAMVRLPEPVTRMPSFLLAIMIAANWWLEKHPQEFQIEGVITNLRDPEFITTRQELFLRNHPIAGKDFQYDWRLITPQRFTGQLELLLQQSRKATIVFKCFQV